MRLLSQSEASIQPRTDFPKVELTTYDLTPRGTQPGKDKLSEIQTFARKRRENGGAMETTHENILLEMLRHTHTHTRAEQTVN